MDGVFKELRSPPAAPKYPQRKMQNPKASRRVQPDDRNGSVAATRKQQNSVGPVIKSRFQDNSENAPAPNAYRLPSTDAYKYGRAARVTIRPRRPAIADDDTPPCNVYRQDGHFRPFPAKTFGRKDNYKRIVYMTVEDFAYY